MLGVLISEYIGPIRRNPHRLFAIIMHEICLFKEVAFKEATGDFVVEGPRPLLASTGLLSNLCYTTSQEIQVQHSKLIQS